MGVQRLGKKLKTPYRFIACRRKYLLQDTTARTPSAPRCHLTDVRTLGSCYVTFLGCIIGSIPKQKREETSLFLVTVPSIYVVKRNYLFWLRAPKYLPLYEHQTNLPQGCLETRNHLRNVSPHGNMYQLPVLPKSTGKRCTHPVVLDTL